MGSRGRRLLEIPLPWVFVAFVGALAVIFLIDSALSQGSSSRTWIGQLRATDAELLAECRTGLADTKAHAGVLAGEMAKMSLDLIELRDLCATQICDESDFAPAEPVEGSIE